MTTFGWVLILFAIIIGKFASQGRSVKDLPGDLGDVVTGAITGDYDAVQDALTRRGTENEYTGTTPTATPDSSGGDTGEVAPTGTGSTTGLKLLAEMQRIGLGRPYVLGTAGPASYDCSGLVWRAMKNLGIYTGARFTTATWQNVARELGAVEVSASEPGVVAWWPGHMGVVYRGDQYFSARSPRYGITMASLETTRKSRGAARTRFWRLR